jgi:hypothetical protein
VTPLELRKIIQVGYRFENPDSPPVLDAQGLPATPVTQPYTATIAFWIPGKAPFQRCAGETKVFEAREFERQALRDGAIVEHLQEFTFPVQPSVEEMRRRLMPVWEALTQDRLGFVPNQAPVDLKPKLAMQFTAVCQQPRGEA